MAWLTDHVFAIREAATETLQRLADKFGADWAVQMILPKVIDLASDTNYLHRMTCIFCFNTLARSIGKDKIVANIFPTLKKVIDFFGNSSNLSHCFSSLPTPFQTSVSMWRNHWESLQSNSIKHPSLPKSDQFSRLFPRTKNST